MFLLDEDGKRRHFPWDDLKPICFAIQMETSYPPDGKPYWQGRFQRDESAH